MSETTLPFWIEYAADNLPSFRLGDGVLANVHDQTMIVLLIDALVLPASNRVPHPNGFSNQ